MTMETDAEDSYFVREDDRGVWNVKLKGARGYADAADWTWTGPKSGVAQLGIDLPDDVLAGEEIHYLIEVTDPSRIDAFNCELTLNLVAQGQVGPSGKPNKQKVFNAGKGARGGSTSTLSLPEVTLVCEAGWSQHGFNGDSALKVVNAGSADESGPTTYDFFINVDNKYLKIIQKETRTDAELLQKQFTYGFVLVGLALLQEAQQRHLKEDDGQIENVENFVAQTTRALAPVLIPMIQAIGGLSVDDF